MNSNSSKIFFLSVLILYLEILLIRWIGTEIRIFSYLQNTILVVAFLGLGMGCISINRTRDTSRYLMPIVILGLLLFVPYTKAALQRISEMLAPIFEGNIWYTIETHTLPKKLTLALAGLFLTFCLMRLLWQTFVPLGRELGALFDSESNVIKAYTANILGSLVGVLLFALLGYLSAPVWIWMLGLIVLSFIVYRSQIFSSPVAAVGFLLLPLLYALPMSKSLIPPLWSPYQKLELEEYPDSPGGKRVLVNTVGYQLMLDLSNKNIDAHPDVFEDKMKGLSHYDLPFKLKRNPGKVLLLGSGVGTDVAAGLRNGAEQIVAVDIDPVIIDIGKKYHPEHPYQSEKVTVVNDDARAYFAHSKEKFDLIVFALLDSHTSTSMTNIRLDHFVYTLESIQEAKALLKPDGILVMSFAMVKDFIAARMSQTLTEVFGQAPIVFWSGSSTSYGWGGMMFVAGNLTEAKDQIEKVPHLKEFVEAEKMQNSTGAVKLATDDWPYLYLERASVPNLYYFLAGLLVVLYLISARSEKIAIATKLKNPQLLHFFLLGTAFMMLETQGINIASVLIGNTWQVNCAVVSGVLLMILFSNLCVYISGKDMRWVGYAGLVGSLILLITLEFGFLRTYPILMRYIAVGLLTGVPVFFSGLVFISSFKKSSSKHDALGANLFGSLFGGLIQSLSFAVGMAAMYWGVLFIYLASAFVLTRASADFSAKEIQSA